MTYTQEVRKASTPEGDCVSTFLNVSGKAQEAWLRATGVPLRARGESAVALALLPAMKAGQPIRIDSPVSARLMTFLPRIQDIYSLWIPPLRPVSVPKGMPRSATTRQAHGMARR